MPNHEHYTGSSHAFHPGHHGHASNPPTASTTAPPGRPPQHQYPATNQQQPHHPGAVNPHYTQPFVEAPYQQSGNFGYANQPLQMPTAPADGRYAYHSDVASAGSQPQFPQTRYPETYPQYRYPVGNMQPAYPTAPSGISGGYPPSGPAASTAHGQQGYMNGSYPHMAAHSGQPPYPPQVHNAGQMSGVADRSGAYSRNAAGPQSQNQPFGNANPPVEPSPSSLRTAAAYQQSRHIDQQHDASTDNTSSQSMKSANRNIVKRRQQNNPHIVKSAVLNPDAAGKCLYLL